MNTIEKTLIQRGYKQEDAISVASELAEVSDCLKNALDKWLKDGSETDYEVEGYSILSLKEQFEMTFPAALLSIDWIIKDPSEAIECIKRGIR